MSFQEHFDVPKVHFLGPPSILQENGSALTGGGGCGAVLDWLNFFFFFFATVSFRNQCAQSARTDCMLDFAVFPFRNR